MFFGYPAAALNHNWLHETLCSTIRTIHENMKCGIPIPKWPDLLPQQFRESLQDRTGLRDRLNSYVVVVRDLSRKERERILGALLDQNEIDKLVSCSSDCESIDDFPESVRVLARDLFSFAFDLLTSVGIRDLHYRCIYDNVRFHLCPFCGCEYFDAPGAPREALDHYLPISKYPFASVNLRNLVPMGNKCNSRYKLSRDILISDDGVRRRSYFPYGKVPAISLCLDRSVPFVGTDGELPRWDIQFDNESEEVNTWLEVFSIRDRYARDVLDEGFKAWLGEFSAWCRVTSITDTDDDTVRDSISRYALYLSYYGLNDRGFLKCAVFRMVFRWCKDGNQRILEVVRDLIAGV